MPQTVVPFIAYADASDAIDWLTEAFGLRENESARAAAARWSDNPWVIDGHLVLAQRTGA